MDVGFILKGLRYPGKLSFHFMVQTWCPHTAAKDTVRESLRRAGRGGLGVSDFSLEILPESGPGTWQDDVR